jgi:hypothetical protein
MERPQAARVFCTTFHIHEGRPMLSTVLIVLLILMLVGALPNWGYSRGWGYGPGGIVGVILLIVVILVLTGHV